MSTPSYRELTVNGLWKNNPALVQLLGLCPLLGVSNSAVNALGLSAMVAIAAVGAWYRRRSSAEGARKRAVPAEATALPAAAPDRIVAQ